MSTHPSVGIVIVTRNRHTELVDCLNSLKKSTYKNLNVVVVDNGSTTPIPKSIQKILPKSQFIRSETNLNAAAGRNLGFTHISADYVLFMDDDAVVDKNTISELVKFARAHKSAGIIQPKIYHKDRPDIFQGLGHNVNLGTGRVTGIGVNEADAGQYNHDFQIYMAGCAWMCPTHVVADVGGYDEIYGIPYEDSDFSIRVRNAGYEVWLCSGAKVYHTGQKATFVNKFVNMIGITSPERAYRVARNKLIIISRHGSVSNQIKFHLCYLPLYIVAHSVIILFSGRFDLLSRYYQGLASGMGLSIKTWLSRIVVLITAWQEPIAWLFDKDSKSVLDVGCGDGLPMRQIKIRHDISYSVGVDLFEPYLHHNKLLQIHHQYIKSDVRDIKFPDNSFDTVICLQVVEHLKSADALKLIKKMERIARKQVIIATPIGEMYHPAVDDNILQLHQSYFYEEDFIKMGYNILKYGRKSLYGEDGLVHKIKPPFLKQVFFALFIPFSFIFYLPGVSDYHIYAYKKISRNI